MPAGVTIFNNNGNIQIDGTYSNLQVLGVEIHTLDEVSGRYGGGVYSPSGGWTYNALYIHAKSISVPSGTLIAGILGLDANYVYNPTDIGKHSPTDNSDIITIRAFWNNSKAPFPPSPGAPSVKVIFFGVGNDPIKEGKYLQIFNENQEQVFNAAKPTLRVYNHVAGNATIETPPYPILQSITKPTNKDIAVCASMSSYTRHFDEGMPGGMYDYFHGFSFNSTSVDIVKYIFVLSRAQPFSAHLEQRIYSYLFVDVTGY